MSGSVISWVDLMLQQAIDCNASDIHLSPDAQGNQLRMRMDGVLQPVSVQGDLHLNRYTEVVARLKLLSQMDIAESRLPQDGAIVTPHSHWRVSSLPVTHGERMALRAFNTSASGYRLQDLHMPDDILQQVTAVLKQPQGMVLVTGPTGSGKTTTLYACLALLQGNNLNVLSAEDPVEAWIPGVSQCQVREGIGRGFHELLRAFLRQDPDVIMVGEIRDLTTASMAVRASLTGHLVLTTLHTGSAPATLVRLVEMGVEPYLIAASLRLVLAQRLLRLICTACSGKGCERCRDTGYLGRRVLYEMLPMHPDIRRQILRQGSAFSLDEDATDYGYRPLRECAQTMVEQGLTTRREVHRVLGG